MSLEKFKDRVKPVGVLYVDVYPYNIDSQGNVKYLILRRNVGVELEGSWQQVTGKIMEGEKIRQSFLRQVKDKTGQIPTKLFKIEKVSTYYDDYYDTVMMVPCAACELEIRSVQLDDSLHKEYKWADFEEAMDLLLWHNQKEALQIIDRMVNNPSLISKFHYLKIE